MKNLTKKVVITGAAGFIGFHLSKRLLETGAEVVGVDCLSDYYDVNLKKARIKILNNYSAFKFLELDLVDQINNLISEVKESSFDAFSFSGSGRCSSFNKYARGLFI